jgi:hypothetical protein
MSIQGSNLVTHNQTDLANSSQYAQSMTLDGNENWFLTHDQFGQCSDCGYASVEESVLSSTGELYAVGQQDAFPYSGRYFSKISNSGEFVFGNEFLTNPWASGFYGLKLSHDESFLFASGYEYFAGYETLGPYLYKLSTDGAIVTSRMIGSAYYNLEYFLVDASDNLFANTSTTDTLRFASFDEELELRWNTEIPVVGYSANGANYPSFFLSNGDVIFITKLDNINENFDQRLAITRIDSEGEVIWNTIHNLNQADTYRFTGVDFTVDEQDNVYAYFARILNTSGGGISLEGTNEDEIERGGKGGETQFRPLLYKFNSDGIFQWTYLENADDPIEFSRVYPANVIVDEQGYTIITSDKSVDFQGVMNYTIVNPTGGREDFLYVNYPAERTGKDLIYGGNRTFYSHTIGSDPDDESQGVWTITKYSYDITTDIGSPWHSSPIQVFPNPVTNHVNITFDLQTQHSVFSIFDVTGRLITNVKTNGSDRLTIDMSDLESGMYMLTNGSQTWPLIKQ